MQNIKQEQPNKDHSSVGGCSSKGDMQKTGSCGSSEAKKTEQTGSCGSNDSKGKTGSCGG